MLKQISNNSIKVAALSLAGVIAYRRLAINHNAPLLPALAASRRTLETKTAGEISYYVAEDQAKHHDERPLVLIHSVNAAASAIEMKPLFEHYRQQRTVYVLDLPGYGFSNRAARDYTPQLFADVIVEFLETVTDFPADVIALSLSCEFVARAAINHTALFHSLVFLSPTGFTGQGDENTTERASRSNRSNLVYRWLSFPLWAQPLYDVIASKPSIRYFLQKSFVGRPSAELIEYGFRTAHQPNAKNVPLHFLSGRLFTPDIGHTFMNRLPSRR